MLGLSVNLYPYPGIYVSKYIKWQSPGSGNMGIWTKISSISSTNIKYNKDCKHVANIEKNKWTFFNYQQ